MALTYGVLYEIQEGAMRAALVSGVVNSVESVTIMIVVAILLCRAKMENLHVNSGSLDRKCKVAGCVLKLYNTFATLGLAYIIKGIPTCRWN